jgi:hypothetical protein
MFSPPKIILIILVLAAVWIAMRWLNNRPTRVARQQRQQPPRGPAAIEDLVACRTCGAYIATNARACGKAGCPQPR